VRDLIAQEDEVAPVALEIRESGLCKKCPDASPGSVFEQCFPVTLASWKLPDVNERQEGFLQEPFESECQKNYGHPSTLCSLHWLFARDVQQP